MTGKPVSIGGSVFRHEATGAGVVMVIERACARLGWSLAGLRCVVQGFGNVGGIAATELAREGRDGGRGLGRRRRDRRPTTASTSRRCTSTSREHGSRRRASRARARSRTHELLELECDVLVLAAREDQVTGGERRQACAAGSSPRARTGRPRSTATRSSPSAASPSCPTCSRTPAASPSRTSSGCRTSAGSSGTATRSAGGSRRSSATRSTACGRCPRSDGLSLRDAALVAGIREVAAALEARGMYP